MYSNIYNMILHFTAGAKSHGGTILNTDVNSEKTQHEEVMFGNLNTTRREQQHMAAVIWGYVRSHALE